MNEPGPLQESDVGKSSATICGVVLHGGVDLPAEP